MEKNDLIKFSCAHKLCQRNKHCKHKITLKFCRALTHISVADLLFLY